MQKSKYLKVYGLVLTISLLVAVAAVSAQAVDWQTLLKQTMPEADKFTQISNLSGYKSESLTQAAFPAYQGSNQIGVVFYSAPRGYGGNINMLVTLDMTGTVRKVNVFSHSETPAYVGALIDGTYQRQFLGITLTDKMVFLIGTKPAKRGEVVAMTGATETSKPIAIAVSEARKLFNEMYPDKQ